MEYVTDVGTAMEMAQGEWAQLAPEAFDTKTQTQATVDGAVETMTTASTQAKQQILERLSQTTTRFGALVTGLDGLNATGRSADSMRAACRDLNTNVSKLEASLNEAFADLDREITELGAEVSDVVAQYGAQFQKAGDLVEDGRGKWMKYLQQVQETHDNSISY